MKYVYDTVKNNKRVAPRPSLVDNDFFNINTEDFL